MKKRLLASLLSLVMVLAMLPTAALATDETTGDEPPVVCAELEGCMDSAHDADCPLYVAPEETGDEHTEELADEPNEPTVAEQLQARIDALPTAEELSAMEAEERDAAYLEAISIDDAIRELPDEEQALLETTKLDAVFAWFNAQTATQPDSATNPVGEEGTESNPWNVSADGAGNNVTAYLTENDDDSTYTLTISGTGAMKDYYQYNATSSDGRTAAPWMASYRESITKVVIKSGVTQVGTFAFALCTNLADADYPEDCVLTRSCFKDTALTSITVYPGNISNDEDVDCTYVFAENKSLTSITFQNGVTTIPDYYVEQAGNLTSITIPSSVTTIGTGAFRKVGSSLSDGSETKITDNGSSVGWLDIFDNIFGTGNFAGTVASISKADGITVNVRYQTEKTFSLFSKISGYTYTTTNSSVVSVEGTTATTGSTEGTATITGTKSDSMTITYNVTVSNEPAEISNWDELVSAFANGGNYRLSRDISYTLTPEQEYFETLLNADDVSVELDLNENTLSVAGIPRLFSTSNGGSIELSNGTVASSVSRSQLAFVMVNGDEDTFSADGVTFTLSPQYQYLISSSDNSTVSLTNCTVNDVTDGVVYDSDDSAKVTISECTYPDSLESVIDGKASAGNYVVDDVILLQSDNINSLTLNSGKTYLLRSPGRLRCDVTVTVPYGATLLIDDGGMSFNDITVESGGTLKIIDGRVTGTITTAGTTSIEGGQVTAANQNANTGAKAITVNGGTFNVSGGEIGTTSFKGTVLSFSGDAEINGAISGGIFTGAAKILDVAENNNNGVKITGGSFTSASDTVAAITDNQGLADADTLGIYSNLVLNGGTIDFSTATKGNTGAYTPVKNRHSFAGWYGNQALSGTPVTTVSSGTTYYAKWTESTYTVGASLECGTVSYGTTITAKEITVSGDSSTTAMTATSSESFNTDCNGLTVTVTPKSDLSVGTYEETIVVTTPDGATHNVTVSLTITKATPEIGISASDTALTGGGTVTLTVTGLPTGAEVNVTCDNGITPTENADGTWTATLPNSTETYTFTASYAGDENHEGATATRTVSVTRYTSSGGGGGGGSTTYTVSVDAGRNGDVTVSPSRASYGDTVTITVDPDEGYELDELIVTDSDGDEISVRSRGDGRYTFTMPRGRVTVKATFVEITEDPDLLTFTDVPASAYYYDAVYWAVENGVTNGTSNTTFSPDASCTRAQMVTFLWRAAGSPEPESSVNPFTDVAASAYYYDAVLWAVEQGITNGTSATTFGPDVTVTRGQTVTFLWRYDGSPAVSGSGFDDVVSDAYYADAVAWAAGEGVTSGTSATTFSPSNDCTRGQIVTFLYRYMG